MYVNPVLPYLDTCDVQNLFLSADHLTALLHYETDLSTLKFLGFSAIHLESVSFWRAYLKAGEPAGKETG